MHVYFNCFIVFRDILAISSEVFYSMFYGALSKPRDPNDPIVDDDIDPEAFRLMLKYVSLMNTNDSL